MASNAAASSSSAAAAGPEEAPRPQAGPLPRKRGEIGFQVEEKEQTQEGEAQAAQSSDGNASMPARHPADRDDAQEDTQSNTTDPSSTSPLPSAPNGAAMSDSASTHSSGKRSLISRLTPRKKLGGLQMSSIILCIIQIIFLAATIIGWVFTAVTTNKHTKMQVSDGSDSANSQNGGTFNAEIFIHVAFAVVTLSQLLFLERCIFRLRAERYMHLHPGAVLPRHMHLVPPSNSSRLAFAPWNRPPLPTYAAALAESGVGTGDVEDNAIAVAPPPAYGNTRGSMMLLSGFMRDSLRAQVREGRRESQMTAASDRPVSYMSHDSDWEVVMDADRARRLEQTLSRLEQGQGQSQREPSANVNGHVTS